MRDSRGMLVHVRCIIVSTQICQAPAGLSAGALWRGGRMRRAWLSLAGAHHVLHLGGDVEGEVGGGAARAPGDVAEHGLRRRAQKRGSREREPSCTAGVAAQRQGGRARQPAPRRAGRRRAGRCGAAAWRRRALPEHTQLWATAGATRAGRAAARRQRAHLVRHHGVHALPQVLHAVVRLWRKKLEREERLQSRRLSAPRRTAATPHRRTSPLATLALILSTICADKRAGRSAVSAGYRGCQTSGGRRSAAQRGTRTFILAGRRHEAGLGARRRAAALLEEALKVGEPLPRALRDALLTYAAVSSGWAVGKVRRRCSRSRAHHFLPLTRFTFRSPLAQSRSRAAATPSRPCSAAPSAAARCTSSLCGCVAQPRADVRRPSSACADAAARASRRRSAVPTSSCATQRTRGGRTPTAAPRASLASS